MFKELYYSLILTLSRSETNDNPTFNAFIGISFFQCMNILSLIGIINNFLKMDLTEKIAIFCGIFLWLIISVLNFFFLYRQREKIISHFKQFPKHIIRKSKVILFIYSISTIIIFIYVLVNLVTPKY